jgi:hypothetical protein
VQKGGRSDRREFLRNLRDRKGERSGVFVFVYAFCFGASMFTMRPSASPF